MSDKLIRDELLRSHRYVSLSNDTTKLLFMHLMLSSDGLSNAEATSTAISIVMGRQITESAACTLLDELAAHDLVRVYENEGKRYVHIPRSRQRIRYLKGKHPRPPVGVEDKEIIELIEKVGLKSDRGQTLPVEQADLINAAVQHAVGLAIKDLQAEVSPKLPEVLLPLLLPKSKALSGSPKKPANTDDAIRLLEFLNRKAGRRFRPEPTTLKPILARLGEYTYDECLGVIVQRWVAWGSDPKMKQWLRPKTLFAPENFANYLGDVPTPAEMAEIDKENEQ